jgi:O-antigen/teichoic acid export membrane protein
MTQIGVEHLERARLKPLSLRANFSWTFAGNLIYAASQWGILVVLAKLGSPEMVGQFALGLAIGAPVIMFANLQLRAVQATDAQREYRFADYLALRLLTTLGALALIVGIIVVSGYAWETALVVFFIGLAKAFEAVSDIFFGLLQQHERMDRIAKSLMIEGPVTLGVMGVVIALTGSLVLATAAMALVWGLQLALYDVRSGWLILRAQGVDARALMRPRFEWATLRRLAWLALPLGFVMMLISLNTSIPRYVIEANLGEAQLGIFAALAYLMVAGGTVINALGQSASPRLAQYYIVHDRTAYWRLLSRLLMVGIMLALAGIAAAYLFGEPLLNLVYGVEYARHAELFVWVTIISGIGFVASCFGYGITAARYFRAQLPLNLLVVCVTTLGAYQLIPLHGLRGVALALILSISVQMIASSAVLLHAMRSGAGLKNEVSYV